MLIRSMYPLAVSLLAVLAGCATQPNTATMFADQAEKCRTAYRDPALDPIRNKLPVLAGLQRPILEMLSDSSRITEEQKPLILLYDKYVIECNNGYSQIFALVGPNYVAVHSQTVGLGQANRADLYQGKITFGEYVQRGVTLSDEFRARLAELDRQRQEAALQRAQAAAAILSSMPAYQPITFQPMQVQMGS